ncbi:hypothetical protein Tco_0593117, partial [Tanacetum coccineum]
KALDDALFAPADRLEFGKCNMRLKIDIKQKEATFQVVMDALALTPFYQAFLIIAEICPKIPGQVLKDLPLEQDILSFIRDLGHTRDITYLTDVNVDYLYQPWRAFSTVINKCLSGKETGMDKIRLSRAQILWGMFYKKNIDYVYLLWEDYLFQIKYKDSKKTNKMSYPIFTNIIIDYFMSKDQSISRRKKMFWHTDQDDTKFTSMRCTLDMKIIKYMVPFSQREKTPKPKYVRKKADPDTSPKQKPVQATKGTRIKSKAKVAKPDKKKQPAKKLKAKGLAVLSEVALTEAEQLKLMTGADEGTGTILGVPDVPIYESKSEKESWGNSEDKDNENDYDDLSDEGDDNNYGNDGDDDDANDNDKQEGDDTNDDDEETDSDRTESDRIKIPILDQSTTKYYEEEEEKIDDEETMDEEEDDEVTKELYDDVNVNLGNEDNAHVILTLVLDTQKADEPVQSSSISSDFTSKLLNLENPSPVDNELASLMETSARHATAVPENTSGFIITIPPAPSFFNPLLQQATPTPTPTTSEATTSFPPLLDFSSIFRFNDRVINMEKDLSEIKQKNVTKSVEAVVLTRSSSQPTSTYEAAASLSEFELTKILIDKIEKNKSNDKADYKKKLYDALVESYNTDKDLFDSYGEVFSLKRSRDERDKDQDPSARSDRGTKRMKLIKDAESSRDSRLKEKKSSSTSKDASQSQHKSSGKSAHAEEPSHIIKDSGMQQDQEFITGENDEQPANKVTKADWFKKPKRPPTPDPD